jgi:hypothetical protein
MIPQGYVPMNRAAVCLDCNAIFYLGPSCPACASAHFMSLERWRFTMDTADDVVRDLMRAMAMPS